MFEMYNYDYIRQQAQLNHINQICEIQKSSNDLRNFLNSLDNIQPQYQEGATVEFCSIIVDYMKRHGMINL